MAFGGATDKLAFLISVNGAEAIRGMKEIGSTADRELGKAQSRLDRAGAGFTKYGAGMMAFSAVAVTALAKAGGAASDLAEETSKAGELFGDAQDEIQAFAQGAASSIGQSERAALEASNTFALFGRKVGLSGSDLVGFSTTFTSLASDLASFNNSTPEEAVEALGAALRGESEPIRRFGVMLDDATLKARALEMGLISTTSGTLPPAIKMQAAYAEILAQTTSAQGDFARTADGMANSQRTAAAEAENAKAALGEGMRPILTAVYQGAADVASGFTAMNEATGGAAAQVVSFGAIGIGVAGVLSSLVGHTIKMRDNLGPLVGKLRNAEGGLNKAGKAAALMGGAFAAIAISDAVFGVLNDVTDAAGKAGTALEKTLIAASEGAGTAAEAFYDMAKAEADALKLSHVWEDFGKKVTLAGDDTHRSIEDLNSAFDKLRESSPQAAEAMIRDLAAQTEALDHNSQQYEDNLRLVADWWIELERGRSASVALTEQQTAEAAALDEAAEATEDKTAAAEEATKAAEEHADALRAEAEALEEQVDAALSAADSWYGLIDAGDEYAAFLDELDGKVTEAAGNERELAALYRDGATAARSVADAAVQYATDQAAANGVTLTARQRLETWNTAMVDAAAQANGPLRRSILDYIATANGIPATKVTEIEAALDRGELDEAKRLLEDASRTRDASIEAEAKTAQAERELSDVARSRTADVTAILRGLYGAGGGSPLPKRDIGGATPGGPTLVHADEVIDLPPGAYVHPANSEPARRARGGTYIDNSRTIINYPPGLDPRRVVDADRRYRARNGPT